MKKLIAFLSIGINLFAGDYSHVSCNQKLSKAISSNIKKSWNIDGFLNGGKFNPVLEEVSYQFYSKMPTSKEEGRKLFIEVVEYILYAYNSNENLKHKYSNFPFSIHNVQLNIRFSSNVDVNQIQNIINFKNKIFFYYVTIDGAILYDKETFEDAYFKVYGRDWDPFKYGVCQKDESPKLFLR